MLCPNCGNDNRAGRRFCSQCGTGLAVACTNCGAGNEAEDLFCGNFKTAAGHFRKIGMTYWLAITLGEHSEWLAAQDRADEAAPLLAEARDTFERLKAQPWLDRLQSLNESRTAAVGKRTAEAP